MNTVAADEAIAWPEVTAFLGMFLIATILIGIVISSWLEARKQKLGAHQADDLRQLVQRFEQLAESTLDAQQRSAADLAELRSRTAAIEKILRSVE
ncbi:hypothetical protein EDD29_5414 [Actinocorallia herbida]|uniref:Uncharacterized protein n=1 Tax=Actinocorallia herbida TaxID=58109 RepID=A0A3N1D2S1_9ACTN|nr:hypothetical protein [Actinocorallia herbida]ROO87776.1 hypothetical protein EDD29_5414 [Actinocorallia herbida]